LRLRPSGFSVRFTLLAVAILLFGVVGGCAPTPIPAVTPTPALTPSPTPVPGSAPAATPAPVVAWSSQFGTENWDRCNAVAVDGEGNIILGGATQGALPGKTLGGHWDAYVQKYSPAGVEQWTLQFTNFNSVGVLAMAVDREGNIIVAGHVQGALPGETFAGGQDDAYVRKYTPDGTELWTHQFGSAGSEQAFGVVADASGNIIVVGGTYGALPGQTQVGDEDAFARMFSPAGVEMWTSQFGTSAGDRAIGVTVDGTGNILVAGRTEGALSGQPPTGSSDAFVREFSPAGDELWTRQFGSAAPDAANAVAADMSGNIIVVGYAMGALPRQTLVGYNDAFVRKLSPAGVEMWTSQFGSPISAGAYAVAVDRDGNIIVAGNTLAELPGQTLVGMDDVFVREFSPAGVEMWTSQFGSPAPDRAAGVAVDGAGDIFIVGDTNGALPGHTQLGYMRAQTRQGDLDAFIIALTPQAPLTVAPGAPLTPQAAKIKVVFHPDYQKVYSQVPAAAPGRMESILEELQGSYDFVKPEPASEEDLRMVHTQRLIDSIKLDPQLYQLARLAVGGAILAGELGAARQPAFALIRPPGHHASADNACSYCYFNNIAVAVMKLLDEKKIKSALIVDIDLHFGNGTDDIFRDDSRVTYYYLPMVGRDALKPPPGESWVESGLTWVYEPEKDRIPQLQALEAYLRNATGYDILAVSAGFDRAKEGRGRIFEVGDYATIGRLLKEAAERNCQGKRFAVLEGGYNELVLGQDVEAFLDGFG
jgi:acetoin utilization deacetylase AcuC-like enzyme